MEFFCSCSRLKWDVAGCLGPCVCLWLCVHGHTLAYRTLGGMGSCTLKKTIKLVLKP